MGCKKHWHSDGGDAEAAAHERRQWQSINRRKREKAASKTQDEQKIQRREKDRADGVERARGARWVIRQCRREGRGAGKRDRAR